MARWGEAKQTALCAEKEGLMTLTVFTVQIMKEEKNDKGRILGRTPIGRPMRFFFTTEEGTPAEVNTARAHFKELQKFLPPDWSFQIVEKEAWVAPGALHFSGKCPTHGPRTNEFFCGMCGTRLTPEIVPD